MRNMKAEKENKNRIKNPSEKKAIRKGIIAALLTDNLILGFLVAENNKDYDLRKNRLR